MSFVQSLELCHGAEGWGYSSFCGSHEKTESTPQPTSAPFFLAALI